MRASYKGPMVAYGSFLFQPFDGHFLLISAGKEGILNPWGVRCDSIRFRNPMLFQGAEGRQRVNVCSQGFELRPSSRKGLHLLSSGAEWI